MPVKAMPSICLCISSHTHVLIYIDVDNTAYDLTRLILFDNADSQLRHSNLSQIHREIHITTLTYVNAALRKV